MPEAAAGQALTREYETIYILRPDVSRDAQERVAARVNEVMGRESGRMTTLENWGRRGLAYPVNNQRRGVYVYVRYLGGGALVSELERNLRLTDEVVKYQTVALRRDLDPASVVINPDDVKFEAVDPPQPGEDEGERIEQLLGFEENPERARHRDSEGEEETEYGSEEPAAEPREETES